jgi:thioredoxin 1
MKENTYNRHLSMTGRPHTLPGWIVAVAILLSFGFAWGSEATLQANQWPAKGMVTMIDLGADKCIPCKMMAPILEKMEKIYAGKAAIVFIDVWKDRAQADRFRIQSIPTQIFFDIGGNEVYRHVGFMSEEAIIAQLKGMGVN